MSLTIRGVSTAGLAMLISLAAAVEVFAQAKPAAPAGPAAGKIAHGALVRSWTGDLDGMVKRRVIRVLTPYSKTHYFVDKGVPRGIIVDVAAKLEETINARLKTTNATKIFVVILPTSRDALYDALTQGKGDFVAAGITVPPERAKLVDFSIPTKEHVNEIVVTGPGAPAIARVGDLSGKQVAVRERSVQLESLQALNEKFKQQGRAPVVIRTVPLALEDEDILEMANAGLLKIVIADDFRAAFWKQV